MNVDVMPGLIDDVEMNRRPDFFLVRRFQRVDDFFAVRKADGDIFYIFGVKREIPRDASVKFRDCVLIPGVRVPPCESQTFFIGVGQDDPFLIDPEAL